MRYLGLDAPGDDTKDARFKEPHFVAVVGYASASKVIREAIITCDDPKQAQQFTVVSGRIADVDCGYRSVSERPHFVQPELSVGSGYGDSYDSDRS